MDPLGMCISQCLTVVNESEDDMLYSQGYCLDLVHAHWLSCWTEDMNQVQRQKPKGPTLTHKQACESQKGFACLTHVANIILQR